MRFNEMMIDEWDPCLQMEKEKENGQRQEGSAITSKAVIRCIGIIPSRWEARWDSPLLACYWTAKALSVTYMHDIGLAIALASLSTCISSSFRHCLNSLLSQFVLPTFPYLTPSLCQCLFRKTLRHQYLHAAVLAESLSGCPRKNCLGTWLGNLHTREILLVKPRRGPGPSIARSIDFLRCHVFPLAQRGHV